MNKKPIYLFLMFLVAACNLPESSETIPVATPPPPTEIPSQSPPEPTSIQHQDFPVSTLNVSSYPDVTSADTAPEKRAPYGDSYEINRLERPFTQEMIYMPDVDIASFGISEDDTWYYISIEMVGKNPNNAPGIRFAVELDTNRDSFSDFLIVADPPFSEEWSAENISIFTDTDRDTAGISASRSDAVFSGNGFDSLIHNSAQGVGSDPDVAWARINASEFATVQFAFKKSFSGAMFFYGVLADAGLKDVARLDYVDYFTEADAGSPVRSNPNYPLKALYSVDNTCYQAVGFEPTLMEPKVCPVIVQPVIVGPQDPGNPGPSPEPTCPNQCPFPGQDPWPSCLCWPG
ncbi:MAG: hypothetical protein DCC59_02070 [Chloroflexi bacterium]|nr:hypothetical protein [Anaerolineales bacterium]RIK55041.1 MAG: hypothetical protein DCC59_02070 [Chloroflexota bacterium]